ncbi:hypothetical protein L495_1289 [Bordetella bronchiseptica CARE970018BB]|nr:hypothetical protein L495_1289 [Bordetella bronchiseptica CARE970018BB]KDC98228.1 hypothetical protein L517_1242 [Bordetella bronchiseptica MBORD670]KDD24884.1 hypothetical protein L526_1289 [Bordetella bronchiseptica MBORD785]KDD32199.1 hypothetical protein L528_1241 [Bordetella bronchiseptica MBORD849]
MAGREGGNALHLSVRPLGCLSPWGQAPCHRATARKRQQLICFFYHELNLY